LVVEVHIHVENSYVFEEVHVRHAFVVVGLRREFEYRVVIVEDLVAAVDWFDFDTGEGV
jgi:hypothetical protein